MVAGELAVTLAGSIILGVVIGAMFAYCVYVLLMAACNL